MRQRGGDSEGQGTEEAAPSRTGSGRANTATPPPPPPVLQTETLRVLPKPSPQGSRFSGILAHMQFYERFITGEKTSYEQLASLYLIFLRMPAPSEGPLEAAKCFCNFES